MSAIDNYGELEMPEEKAEIEVVEDPVKTVMSIYELYEKIADKTPWNAKYDSLYFETEKLLKERENLQMSPEQVNEIMKFFSRKQGYKYGMEIGLFLSALHNNTNQEIMIIDNLNNTTNLGYKLNKNKKLVFKRSHASVLGNKSEGIIINYGDVNDLGRQSIGGLQINFGTGSDFAKSSKGGLYINAEKINDFGSLNGGLHIDVSRRYSIALENVIDLNKSEYSLSKQQTKLKRRLENRLKELKVLQAVENESYERIYKTVKSFNFKKFEQDITDLATELKNTRY